MSDLIKYKDYYATVHFSTEDEVFYGKILGITDLVTFEGESVKALKRSFKEAIEDYVTTCHDIGKTPEKTYKGSFNIRISPHLHREAVFVASEKNITLNDFVKDAINYAVKHKEIVNKGVA